MGIDHRRIVRIGSQGVDRGRVEGVPDRFVSGGSLVSLADFTEHVSADAAFVLGAERQGCAQGEEEDDGSFHMSEELVFMREGRMAMK